MRMSLLLVQSGAQTLAPLIEDRTAGPLRSARVDAQQSITVAPGVHVEVQVGHLLVGGRPDRVPDAQAFVIERAADGAGHPGDTVHQGRRGQPIGLADVGNVYARHHEHVTRVGLPQVEKGDRPGVAV